MSRKFNIGRQNDMLLNERMHELYTHLEFIPYENGNSGDMPHQIKQTEIPRGALWLHDTQNTGNSVFKLRVHTDPSQSDLEDRWPCVFEGYYQPAALKADLNTMNPDKIAYGQLRLDDGNILRFWDNSTWQPVYASPSNDNLVIFNGLNFQRISPLTKDLDDDGNEIQQEQYYVPYEHYGKYFTAKNYSDELIYCHPIPEADLAAAKPPKYNGNHSDNTRITLPSDSASYAIKSWVHVNPQCLNNVTKRFLKIDKNSTGYIPIIANMTEFYAFKTSNGNDNDEQTKIGRLLKHHSFKQGMDYEKRNIDLSKFKSDYRIENGGIVLEPEIMQKYDYIYAITYDFKPSYTVPGEFIRKYEAKLGEKDQLYVGLCSDIPTVFMDGLYLEHRDDNGAIYTYDRNGYITFANNSVLDTMQITVVSFPKVNTYTDGAGNVLPREYDMAAGEFSDPYEKDGRQAIDLTIKGYANDSVFAGNGFINPIVFYTGLAGFTFAIINSDKEHDDGIRIDKTNHTITIKDYGSLPSHMEDDKITEPDSSTVFIVDAGDNYVGHGTLVDGVITDKKILANKDYLVIVDGIVMSPFNDDITVEDGRIFITDSTIAKDSEYVIIQLSEDDGSKDTVLCIYDDYFAPYTISLRDATKGVSSAYNDCDAAVVMCGPGALVDRDSIFKEITPNDTFVGGQIVRMRMETVNNEEIYEWRLYKFSNDYVTLDPVKDAILINDCENVVAYHVNKGTIQLAPGDLVNQPVTVYAYTYADSFDELSVKARRNIAIEVSEDKTAAYEKSTFYTNRTHLFDTGANALSVYVNGLLVPHTEKTTPDPKNNEFYVNKLVSSSFMSHLDKTSVDMYNVLKTIKQDTELRDIITIISGMYSEEVFPSKYFNDEYQLGQAKLLKKYIEEDMKQNTLLYIVENKEKNEMASCRRHWNMPRNENGNLPNSYTTTMRLTPGIINVYVNGVLLEKSDYAVFDNNKVMIGFDLVGGQEILGSVKKEYNCPYRVITEEGLTYIECESPDEVTIEVRDDLNIKKRTYTIKDISYDTHSFDIIDYEYPTSLSTTKDLIKIYINGVLYDGDYTNVNGVITLLDCDLERDPLYEQLRMQTDLMDKYEKLYGEYKEHEDIITFEWR